ncbi:E3 ubiquitin-protein ligase IPI1-like [Solanum verrucosum]|uniref:E3 ubiquitin-protein ligase IPI1-like n=1 Tax=Solanum verrucosum TaxID=315347 RepID=UPI0020CFF8DF|nr:E3 ubiquitin-protein ligase IPI1-like [Solanum verrucosum]
MANNIFPNGANPPLCTLCLETVVDDSTRAITKLVCQHFFHSDCIGSEFNLRGEMKCPNCRVVEEDGIWMRFTNSDSDFDAEDGNEENVVEDEHNEEQPEDENRQLFRAIVNAYTGSTSHMRDEMNNDVSRNGAPPNFRHTTFQTNNGLNIFSRTFVVYQSPILQQNELPPPPIDVEMVDQGQISSSDANVGSNSVTHETSTLYEQARNNLLPCLELTLATGGTSLGDGRPLPPCQCICCRAS